MKRIVSIQDLSCIGKCSLGIALPVLSAMGLEFAVLPTALLSAHTAFPGFYSQDLSPSFSPIMAHWKDMNLEFQGIYTGYLGSPGQISRVEQLIREFRQKDTLIFVDPVMGDQGRLYPGFGPDFPQRMKALCSRADVITPNVTEACLLTGTDYARQHSREEIQALLEKLLGLGAKTAVITGIRQDEAHMSVAVMDGKGTLSFHTTDYLPKVYYGTGDLFSSVCAGAMTLGLPGPKSIALAADYVVQTIRATNADPNPRWYGVNFEETLPYLMERLGRLQKGALRYETSH